MTVCIATMCVADGDDGPMVVVAADRMVTLGTFMEFEHTNPKMKPVSPFAVILIAGDTLIGTRLAADVCDQYRGTAPPIGQIASTLSQAYSATRQMVMEEKILKPRGLDINSYYARQPSLNPNTAMMLDNELANFNLGVELLLAGVDAGGAHVHSVHNPGGPQLEHNVIGYAAIGSGAIHASPTMIRSKHHAKAPFRDALYQTYAAKRNAEAAIGVGLDTDLLVISREGQRVLGKEQMDELDDIYKDVQKKTDQSLRSRLEELSVEVLRSEADSQQDGPDEGSGDGEAEDGHTDD